MKFTAEYSGNVVMDNNTSYPGFYMVEHEPVIANKIFTTIHKNAPFGFADCFPPIVSRDKICFGSPHFRNNNLGYLDKQ